MNDLLDRAVAAHGGLDRFNQFKTVSASLVTGGALLLLKGQAGFLNTHVTVELHQERASPSAPILAPLSLVIPWKPRGMLWTASTSLAMPCGPI